MAKRSSISPTLTVFGVWWVATAYFAPSYDWTSMVQMGAIAGFGILLGIVGAIVSIAVIRVGYRSIVSPSELRGLNSSIGEVPLPKPEPLRADELPAISPVTMPDIPADFVDNWLDEYGSEYPQHAELFKALLRVLNFRPDLPATHVHGGHGGRTLLQHSMLTAWIMAEVSKSWKYDGLRDRSGKRVVLPLRDPQYEFNSHDPMVAIIGLAHDIGKIESFVYNEQGDVVGIRSEHDLTGSRMIARMQETWDIPSTDRNAMLLAIAHYHHPVELPLAPNQRKAVARDDRTIALMELLINADFKVTSVETRGVMPSEEEYRSYDSVRSVSPEQLYGEFVALIHEAHRINSGNIKYSVGQLSPSPDGKGGLLYLHEESLRLNMMRRLGMQNAENLGNGRFQITVDLLNVLKARGILYTTHENLDYSAGNAMWVCDVLGSKNQRVSSWPCVIAVKLERFEKLQQLGFFSSSIKIIRNRFGEQMGKPVKGEAGDTIVFGGLGSNNDIPDAPAVSKKKNNPPKATSQSPKPQTPPQTKAVLPDIKPQIAPVVSEPSVEPVPLESLSDRVEPVLPTTEVVIVESDASDRVEPVLTVSPETSVIPGVATKIDIPEQKTDATEPHADDVQVKTGEEEGAASAQSDRTPEIQTDKSAMEPADAKAAATASFSVNGESVARALQLAVTHCKSGMLGCRKGIKDGKETFNFTLDDLLDSMVAPDLSSPGVVDYLASGRIKGVGVVRIKSRVIISVSPPLSSE